MENVLRKAGVHNDTIFYKRKELGKIFDPVRVGDNYQKRSPVDGGADDRVTLERSSGRDPVFARCVQLKEARK